MVKVITSCYLLMNFLAKYGRGVFTSRKVWCILGFQEYQHNGGKSKWPYKIKTLCSDNGGEYIDNSFKMFYEEHGIYHSLTIPRSQQNDVAERRNMILWKWLEVCWKLCKSQRSFGLMLFSAFVDHYPTKIVKNMTPQEAWSRFKQIILLLHLQVFKSIALSYIPKK